MELFRALGALVEPPVEALAPVAEALDLGPLPPLADHTELFSFQLYPYASVYLGPEGMMGGEARDRIAGFYGALRQTPPPEPDHLTELLNAYTQLCQAEEARSDRPQVAEAFRHLRKAYFWEHLASWLPPYLRQVQELGTPFYQRWAALLLDAMTDEAAHLGEPAQISAHLLDAPGLIDPRTEESPKFLDSLLAPVRSGMILTRADLLRAARKLDIGIRMGERKYILSAMFEQDGKGMIGWLAEEAKQWTVRHESSSSTFGATSEAWETKATGTSLLLAELSAV
jgi:TorA maturation chaperone TorD